MHRARLAFTLIELLAVIAILAILAALLPPALGRGKASAQGMQCANNLKQLFVAWTLYADDHNGRLRRWNALLEDFSWQAGPKGLRTSCSLKPMDLLSILNIAKRQETP
jgi:prepilin-type N-terminal cleavage/methylation domain-containing protein